MLKKNQENNNFDFEKKIVNKSSFLPLKYRAPVMIASS